MPERLSVTSYLVVTREQMLLEPFRALQALHALQARHAALLRQYADRDHRLVSGPEETYWETADGSVHTRIDSVVATPAWGPSPLPGLLWEAIDRMSREEIIEALAQAGFDTRVINDGTPDELLAESLRFVYGGPQVEPINPPPTSEFTAYTEELNRAIMEGLGVPANVLQPPPEEPVTPDTLRALLGGAGDGASAVRFDAEGKFSDN